MKTTSIARRCIPFGFVAVAATELLTAAALARQVNTPLLAFGFGQTSGRTDVRVYAISNDGATAVGSRNSDYYDGFSGTYLGSALEPFHWSITSGSQTSLAALVPIQNTEAYGISGNGDAITGTGSTFPQSHLVNWRRNANGAYTLANSGVYPGGVATTGLGATYDGAMVVGYIRYPNGQNQSMRQFVGTAPIENLGAITVGADSAARACSGDGTVIVGNSDGAIGTKAARWFEGTWSSLGTLPGGSNSYAYGISRDGQHIVGFSEFAGSGTNYHPFRHTMAGGMVDLGLPPMPGFSTGYAFAVNDDATVIVGEVRASQGSEGRATVWTPQSGTLLLKAALISAGYPIFEGITLVDAVGVSGDGRRIVGNGYLESDNRPVAWTIRDFSLAPTFRAGLSDAAICAEDTQAPLTLTVAEPPRGLPPLTISWTRDGQPLTFPDPRYTADGTTLNILNAADEPEGTVFACVATNALGSGSVSSIMRRIDPPVFVTQPSTFTRCGDQRWMELSVELNADASTALQWQVFTEADGWIDIQGSLSGQTPLACGGRVHRTKGHISIDPCPDVTHYPLRAIATNICGSVTSDTGAYIVDTSAPVIVRQPVSDLACPTGSATLSVEAAGPVSAYLWQVEAPPTGSDTWLWLFDGTFVIAPFAELTFAGAFSDALQIQGSPANEQSGLGEPIHLRFRCLIAECGVTTSNPATLTLCPADLNCDGIASSQDFFDFITAFFTSDLLADFNHTGNVNSQDFFDFISAFFAGC